MHNLATRLLVQLIIIIYNGKPCLVSTKYKLNIDVG